MADFDITLGGKFTGAPAFQAAGAALRALSAPQRVASAGFVGMAHAAERFNQRVSTFHHRLGQIGQAARSLASPLLVATGAVTRLGAAIGRVSGMSLKVGAGVGVAGLAGIAAGMGAIARVGIDMNVTLAGATTALTRMTGSAANATALIAGLRKEALTSSLTFKDMLPIAQSLVGVLGARGIGQVIPIMRAFGDAATALQVPQESLNLSLLGFRQLLGRDFAQQEELNQIGENLPGANISGILKQRFGTADTEDLKAAGVTGQQVGMAIIAGLQKAFGGSQGALGGSIPMLASSIQDTFNDLTAGVSKGLTASLGKAMGNVGKLLSGLGQSAAGQKFLGGLTTIFDGLGKALEKLSLQGEGFVKFLGEIVNRQNVVLFLSNVIALLQTVGTTLAKVFGVDLAKAMDPKNVMGWFDALGQGVANGINTVFALVRVFGEGVRTIRSFFEDLGDQIKDQVADITFVFKAMFLGLEISMGDMVVSMLESTKQILEGLNKLKTPWGTKVFNFDTFELDVARSAVQTRRNRAVGNLAEAAGDEMDVQKARREREARQAKEDPRRDMDPWSRLSGAFQGKFGSRKPENAFWANFARNRLLIQRGLFANQEGTPVAAPTGGGGIPRPAMYGTRGGGSVTTSFVNPASEAWKQYRGGGAAAGGAPSGDPFAPVKLPDGRVVARQYAEAMGLLKPAGAVPPPAEEGDAIPAAAGATTGGGAAGGVSVPITIYQFDLGDPSFRQLLYQAVGQALDALVSRQFPRVRGR